VYNINLYFCRREFGLEKFVPNSLLEGMKRKELRKLLGHFLKVKREKYSYTFPAKISAMAFF